MPDERTRARRDSSRDQTQIAPPRCSRPRALPSLPATPLSADPVQPLLLCLVGARPRSPSSTENGGAGLGVAAPGQTRSQPVGEATGPTRHTLPWRVASPLGPLAGDQTKRGRGQEFGATRSPRRALWAPRRPPRVEPAGGSAFASGARFTGDPSWRWRAFDCCVSFFCRGWLGLPVLYRRSHADLVGLVGRGVSAADARVPHLPRPAATHQQAAAAPGRRWAAAP